MIESKRVLIVEDESIVALEIQERLMGFGYMAIIVSSGEEAIKKAGEFHPDIILMDIMLKGGMDGIEAAGRIRKSMDIPIVT